MPESDLDRQIRQGAFEHVMALQGRHKSLAWQQIQSGFSFEGTRIHLATRARGIFKPRQMDTILSIKTVIPRPGRHHWYDDQTEVRQTAFDNEDHFSYAFEGGGPTSRGNRLLRQAYEEGIPFIYFFPLAPGHYQPIVPTFVYGWDPIAEKCQVGPAGQEIAQGVDRDSLAAPGRRYAIRRTRQRLHQSLFRHAVLDAYGRRCALSGLPETQLLDAAHIVPDRDETLGQPVVSNGLLLSSIHHAAFDNNLMGIDPDYCAHVSERLLDLHDGPMLDALKRVDGTRIHLPKRRDDYPDQARLELRYRQFEAAAYSQGDS